MVGFLDLLGEVLPEVGPPAFLPQKGHAQEEPGQKSQVARFHEGTQGTGIPESKEVLRKSFLQGKTFQPGQSLGEILSPAYHPGCLAHPFP